MSQKLNCTVMKDCVASGLTTGASVFSSWAGSPACPGKGNVLSFLPADGGVLHALCMTGAAGGHRWELLQHPCTSPSAIPGFLWEEGWPGHSVFLPEQCPSPLLVPSFLAAVWQSTESRVKLAELCSWSKSLPTFCS